MNTLKLVLPLVVLFAIACKAPTPPAEPAEVQLAPTPVNKAPQRFRPSQAAAPEGLSPRAQKALSGVLAIATEMRDAAKAAAGTQTDLCARAFLATTAAARVSREAQANGRFPRPPPTLVIAPRARYLALCGTLPEDAKRCASFAHRVDNAEACRRSRDGLTVEQRETVDEMAHQQER